MDKTKPILNVRGVYYSFGEGEAKTEVLKDNNLEVLPGEVVILTGKSGSGKTTLLTLIGALRRLQQGEVDILDWTLTPRSSPSEMVMVRRNIGYIFQAHNLFRSLTALQNVRMGLELTSNDPRYITQRALEVLKRLDLHSDNPQEDRVNHKPDSMSGGQNQRVAIARAIAHKPRLILADEPTAALDEHSGLMVVDLFEELARNDGCTVIIVTHDNRIVDKAHRFVGMEFGHIRWSIRKSEVHEITSFLRNAQGFSKMLEGKVTTTGTLSDIAVRLQRRRYPAGAVIVRQGEEGKEMFILKSGRARVLVNSHRTGQPVPSTRSSNDLSGMIEVAQLKPGDIFGEAALLNKRNGDPSARKETRNATVVAVDDVEVYVLGEQDFDNALAASDPFGYEVERIRQERQRRDAQAEAHEQNVS